MKSNTHDLSAREWGCDYSIQEIRDDGYSISLSGWTEGIEDGDYIIIRNGDGTTRYKVDSIRYYSDPKDMFSAEASFSPRE